MNANNVKAWKFGLLAVGALMLAGWLGAAPAQAQGRDPYATIRIAHPEADRVTAELGAVGNPFRALRVDFDDAWQVVRQRMTDDGARTRARGGDNRSDRGAERGRGRWYDRDDDDDDGYWYDEDDPRAAVEVTVDLSRYERYLDGRREWYLRLNSPRETGVLHEFSIVQNGVRRSVRNVPVRFGDGRRIEARVTPAGNGGGSNPYPPNNPYPGDGYGDVAVRRYLPNAVRLGQRTTLEVRVDSRGGTSYTGYGNARGQLNVTEEVPSGWRITGVSPRASVDAQRNIVRWTNLDAARDQRLRIELMAPNRAGTYRFEGRYQGPGMRSSANTPGDNRVVVDNRYGGGYDDRPNYPGDGYDPYDPYDNDPYDRPDLSRQAVVRSLPRDVDRGQRWTIVLRVNTDVTNRRLVVIQEVPRDFRMVGVSPRAERVDHSRNVVMWILDRPRRGDTLRIEVQAPDRDATYTFNGRFGWEGERNQDIGGDDRVEVGRGGYDRSRDDDNNNRNGGLGLDDILDVLLGRR